MADSRDAEEFSARLDSLQESWECLCPGFYQWFCQKRKHLFVKSVIESARSNVNIQGLFYNNSIESEHYCEKKEQSFQKGGINDVIKTLKCLTERQEDEEVRAIYGSGLYSLSKEFKKFEMNSVRWHSMKEEERRNHVAKFRSYRPILEDYFEKPKASGRTPNERKRDRKPEADLIFDRLKKEKNKEILKEDTKATGLQFSDPDTPRKVTYELHLRSNVHKCHGNCGDRLVLADKDDYLLIKSFG